MEDGGEEGRIRRRHAGAGQRRDEGRIAEIARWAEQHIEAVQEAQRRYDAAGA